MTRKEVLKVRIELKMRELFNADLDELDLIAENIKGYFMCMLDLDIIDEEIYLSNCMEVDRAYKERLEEIKMIQEVLGGLR